MGPPCIVNSRKFRPSSGFRPLYFFCKIINGKSGQYPQSNIIISHNMELAVNLADTASRYFQKIWAILNTYQKVSQITENSRYAELRFVFISPVLRCFQLSLLIGKVAAGADPLKAFCDDNGLLPLLATSPTPAEREVIMKASGQICKINQTVLLGELVAAFDLQQIMQSVSPITLVHDTVDYIYIEREGGVALFMVIMMYLLRGMVYV